MNDGRYPRRISALLLVTVCVVCLLGCDGQKHNDSSSRNRHETAATKAPVKVVAVAQGTIQSWISLTATLLPIRESRVGAKVAGRVAEVLADEGDSVEQGDALFMLEQRDFELARDQARHGLDAARANLSATKINLANAKREYNRLKGLRASNAVSQQEYDVAADASKAAQASVNVADASVNVARDALEMARYNLSQSTVRSPISGQVARRNVNVGELVSPVSLVPCFYVVDDSVCKAEAHLPDTRQSSVMMSQEVKMTIDGVPEREFSGTVTHIGDTIDPLSRTLIIRARIDNPDGVLRSGSLARLKILADKRMDVVVAPIRCIVKRNGNPVVFVVSSSIAVARPVRLGLVGEEGVEIVQGLHAGDVVVIDGTESLEDGMAVEAINPGRIE